MFGAFLFGIKVASEKETINENEELLCTKKAASKKSKRL